MVCMWQEGETALYQAAEHGEEECALLLLEAGCDPNILTKVQRATILTINTLTLQIW